jgi:hypothetical protein
VTDTNPDSSQKPKPPPTREQLLDAWRDLVAQEVQHANERNADPPLPTVTSKVVAFDVEALRAYIAENLFAAAYRYISRFHRNEEFQGVLGELLADHCTRIQQGDWFLKDRTGPLPVMPGRRIGNWVEGGLKPSAKNRYRSFWRVAERNQPFGGLLPGQELAVIELAAPEPPAPVDLVAAWSIGELDLRDTALLSPELRVENGKNVNPAEIVRIAVLDVVNRLSHLYLQKKSEGGAVQAPVEDRAILRETSRALRSIDPKQFPKGNAGDQAVKRIKPHAMFAVAATLRSMSSADQVAGSAPVARHMSLGDQALHDLVELFGPLLYEPIGIDSKGRFYSVAKWRVTARIEWADALLDDLAATRRRGFKSDAAVRSLHRYLDWLEIAPARQNGRTRRRWVTDHVDHEVVGPAARANAQLIAGIETHCEELTND